MKKFIQILFLSIIFFIGNCPISFAYFQVMQNKIIQGSGHNGNLIVTEKIGTGYQPPVNYGPADVLQLGGTKRPCKNTSPSKGLNLPFGVVMTMVIPSDWHFYDVTNNPETMTSLISWDNHGSWINGLEAISSSTPYRFVVNWDTKTIFIKNKSNTKS